MKNLREFQTRTAQAVLTGIVANTIRKIPRFKDVKEEDVVAESFKAVNAEVRAKGSSI